MYLSFILLKSPIWAAPAWLALRVAHRSPEEA
jgi:hypothetical protein